MSKSITFLFYLLLYLGCRPAVTDETTPTTVTDNTSESTTTASSTASESNPTSGTETSANNPSSDSTTADSSNGETGEVSTSTSISDSTTVDSSTGKSSQSTSTSDTPTGETEESLASTSTSDQTSPDSTSNSDSSMSDISTDETKETSAITSNSPDTTTPSTSTFDTSTGETEESSTSTSTSDKTSPDSTSTSDSSSVPDISTTITSTSDITTTTSAPTTSTPVHITRSFKWTDSDVKTEYSYIVVQVDSEYDISVTVSDVVMPDGSYLLIEGGDSHDDDATDGRVFANTVKGPLKYLFKTTSVYASCKIDTSQDYKFTVVFEREGEVTTTVSTSTTTEMSWPSTEAEDSIYITVNVSGKYLKDYTEEVQEDFKSSVVCMAEAYLQTDISINHENITTSNVIITSIRQCPYSWPDSATCAQIQFKLPIFYKDSNWQGYMLTTKHLEVMWLRHADGCFSNNFAVYEEPDFDTSIIGWAVGIVVVIVCFILLLLFLKAFSSRMKVQLRKRNRRNSDTMSIISSKRESLLSLGPHYMQDTPKLFET